MLENIPVGFLLCEEKTDVPLKFCTRKFGCLPFEPAKAGEKKKRRGETLSSVLLRQKGHTAHED